MTRKNRKCCIEICQSVGLTVLGIKQGKKHMTIICTEGPLFCASTPSCRFWLHNVRRDARNLQRAWDAKQNAA